MKLSFDLDCTVSVKHYEIEMTYGDTVRFYDETGQKIFLRVMSPSPKSVWHDALRLLKILFGIIHLEPK